MPRLKMLLLLCSWAAWAAPPQDVNWRKVNAETLRHFTALLHIDTSDPPGNETAAARYLAGVLEAEGIPVKLLARDPARANLVARIAGSGSARPIAILGHTDVVGAQRSKWTVDPFAAVRKKGFIYGRGAMDDKEIVTAGLMVMLLLQREHVNLKRDVIFVAEAGEEGEPEVGIDFLVNRHWNEIAAEYALAEGGSVVAQGGTVRYVAVSTAEKVPRGVRLIARGPSGHGSRPSPDNAVLRLAAAVARLGDWHTPMRLNETTRAYFERLASISPPGDADRYRHVDDPARAPDIDSYFARYEPAHYDMVRTTLAPTMLKAGFAFNVIPSEAEAYIDIRALPDEDIPRFYEEMRAAIADQNVDIEPQKPVRPATAPSRTDTILFRALEHAQRKMFPNAVTLPLLLTGATDMAELRARGVQAYGFGPIVESGDPGEAHANDERLAEASLYKLVEFLWYTILEAAG
ncbi:MAG TPA: M20/M25/M40 family metallo-hydrolase [Bryobacteraceae bacterium]|jgi:acetylornithine deacetylase/succinyl-diaminopimelate desuccinylase-like protein|nr:M20/M25/M40 family metallo-hydrolase [Bryobacteraceae bacterium]